jgi:PAS domain S-box-containing protein
MPQVKRFPLLRYGLAVLTVALATIITWLIPPLSESAPFSLFFVAVVVSTFYGGRWSGLLAIALALLIGAYLFIPPKYSLGIGKEGLFRVSVFALLTLVITFFMERIRRAEAQARASREHMLTTLRSIGDAVITTDAQGRVTFLNKVAQELTGWTPEEARGKDLREVFHIVNEETRNEVESPVAKVIREGAIVGLANHTTLIAKDGRETPIDDSGAPIRDERGEISGVVLVFRNIMERRRAEELHYRLASIVESSEDAIIGKTLDGIITNWNEGAERLYGYSAAEVINRSISILIPPERPDELPSILDRLKRGERIEHLETTRLTKDGRVIDVALTISPIKSPRGAIIGASTIARDITEQKRAEKEREQLLMREKSARIEAENANRTKDEFLATLSHELRTPLTAMLGWTKLLLMKQLDEAMATRALETVERNAKAQAQLIEDLLDASRIITGNQRLDVRAVELVPIINAAIDSMRPAVNAKAIDLQTSLDPLAGPVSGDPARLQQIVWNLLSNAVKFTASGGQVSVRLGRANSHVEITVSDTGQGISQEFLPFIFDRFRQADSSTTRAHGGLGLGLAIVRHLVELHGGTVHAESRGEGEGATFRVRLPALESRNADFGLRIDRDEESFSQSAIRNPQSAILEGLRLLVVDDDKDALEMMKTVLEKQGANVITARSTQEALEAFEREKPDMLISDIGMPGQDGYDLIRQVRARSEAERGSIPAAAVSAYVGEENRRQALEAGFHLHVAKPLDTVDLIEVVRRLAEKQ